MTEFAQSFDDFDQRDRWLLVVIKYYRLLYLFILILGDFDLLLFSKIML